VVVMAQHVLVSTTTRRRGGECVRTAYPYTTLFRYGTSPPPRSSRTPGRCGRDESSAHRRDRQRVPQRRRFRCRGDLPTVHSRPRSEEHTSELQLREKLVCRLPDAKKILCMHGLDRE